MTGKAEEGESRRLKWIAASFHHTVAPSVLAHWIRATGGGPPELPIDPDRPEFRSLFRPSDRRKIRDQSEGAREALALVRRAEREGWTILTPEDGGWLETLWQQLVDPPVALYVRGTIHPIDQPAVSIVGSRHPTENGRTLARSFARCLAAEGIVIVSGMALGIDAAAHRGALDVDGRTIAVLGSGIDQPTPNSHHGLAEAIVARGALVSEFPPGTGARPLHFPRRNRLIAALAPTLVVVEGGEKSGARSTVDHALALGREVAAIPRDPIHEGSSLPNELLRCGATPVCRPEDLLQLVAESSARRFTRTVTRATTRSAARETEPLDQRLLRRIDRTTTGVERLAQEGGCSSRDLFEALARLELLGKIRRLPGHRYQRIES